MEYWNHIYEHFNPVALDLGFMVHWYGIMYISALLVALWFAKWIIKRDNMPISEAQPLILILYGLKWALF